MTQETYTVIDRRRGDRPQLPPVLAPTVVTPAAVHGTSGPAAPSGKQVLDGTPGYLISTLVSEIKTLRLRALGATAERLARFITRILVILDHHADRVDLTQINFDAILWTKEARLVLPLTYNPAAPPQDPRHGVDEFVDTLVRPPLGNRNELFKSLVAGLCDQWGAAARWAPDVDLHRIRLDHVRATRRGEIVADLRLGRRPFFPRDIPWM